MEIGHHGYRLLVPEGASHDAVEFGRWLLRLYEKYAERDLERQGVWRNSGIRGQAQSVYAKGERAFTAAMRGEIPHPDNFIDAANYSIFALMLMDESDTDRIERALNGKWPWDG